MKKVIVLHSQFEVHGGAMSTMKEVHDFLSSENNMDSKILGAKKLVRGGILLHFFTLLGADIVICGNPPSHLIGAIVKCLRKFMGKNTQVIWWHHHIPWLSGTNVSKPQKIKRWIEKKLICRHIDTHVCTSKFIQSKVNGYLGVGVSTKVIYPLVNIPLRTYPYEQMPDDGRLNILWIGRLEPGKGYETAISVINELNAKPEAGSLKPSHLYHLHVAGSGSIKPVGAKYVTHHGFLNHTDIETLASKCHIGWFTSEIDALGMSAIEMQLLGLPTIILNHSGSPETATSEIAHLVDTIEEFTSVSRQLLDNWTPVSTKEMTSIKNSITSVFGEKRFVEEIKGLLR